MILGNKSYFCPAVGLRITLFFASLLFAVSCSRQTRDEEQALARVESQTVTLDDLKKESYLNYFSLGESAEHWIDEQVLLHHAKNSDFIDRSRLATRLNEHEQQVVAGLLIDSLLQRYIQIDPELIREYYINNIHDFQFQDSAALVTHLGFHRLDTAKEALEILRMSRSARDSLLSLYNFDRQLVYRRRTIPALDQAIFSAEIDRFYGPLVTDFGYHLVVVEHFYEQGHTIPFSLVRKHIYERLFQMQLPLARSTILDSLREMLDVEVYHD